MNLHHTVLGKKEGQRERDVTEHATLVVVEHPGNAEMFDGAAP